MNGISWVTALRQAIWQNEVSLCANCGDLHCGIELVAKACRVA